jgi:hypothetical protein
VPIDADRLPEYAGTLHDAGTQHPEVARFMMWYHLERGEFAQRAAVTAAMGEKVAAIEQAQQRGTVTSGQSAAQILALVLTLANMWHRPGEDLANLAPEHQRRGVVVNAVARLVKP